MLLHTFALRLWLTNVDYVYALLADLQLRRQPTSGQSESAGHACDNKDATEWHLGIIYIVN
jgi:hypothetical protein